MAKKLTKAQRTFYFVHGEKFVEICIPHGFYISSMPDGWKPERERPKGKTAVSGSNAGFALTKAVEL